MSEPVVACVEIGGSGAQTVVFADGAHRFADGIDVPTGAAVGVAAPGRIDDGRITMASTFGWADVDPFDALGLPVPPAVVVNDAEAAALGEWVLRGAADDALVYVGLGTGIGGAVVAGGSVTNGNLFGHQGGFGDRVCSCGNRGCLETVAAGWALPRPLDEAVIGAAAGAVATAIGAEPAAARGVVVVAGGLADRYPGFLTTIAAALPGRTVIRTSRPAGAKSAAAWGLRRLLRPTEPDPAPQQDPAPGPAIDHAGQVRGRLDLRVRADAAAVAEEAADIIVAALAARPELRLGVATGSTPLATYAELGRRHVDLGGASIWLLDEYVGLGADDPRSYRATVVDLLGRLLGVRADQVHGPAATTGEPAELETAARRYDEQIAAAGGVDLQILGIGRNGHIGFNEPGSPFDQPTRVVELTETTRVDNARFFDGIDDVPRQAITQGISTILRARRLLLIATGPAKAAALRGALTDPISPTNPASAIRLHPDAVVVADEASASGLEAVRDER